MKYILLFSICFIVIYGYNVYIRTKDILNPILAFSLPILVSIIVNLLFYDRNYQISSRTYTIYLLGVIAFVAGYMTTFRSSSAQRLLKSVDLKYNSLMFRGYKIIAGIGTIISIFYIYKAATYGLFGTNAIRNIRWYSLYVEQNNLIGKYSIIFIEVAFCIYAYKLCVLGQRDKKTKCCYFLFAMEYIIAIITTMARTVILQFVIEAVYFFIWGIQNNQRGKKRKFKIKIIIFGLICLYLMQILAEKTEKAVYIDEITGRAINWMIPYFGKQFYIFEEFISQHAWVTRGVNSFGFWGRFLRRLGILMPKYVIDIPGGQVAAFITEPYTDFGIFGVLVVMLVNGMIIGYIYRRAVKYSGWWLIFYSVCIYSCVIAFYAFQFAMSSQLYFAVVAMILFIDNKFCLHIRNLNVLRKKKVESIS